MWGWPKGDILLRGVVGPRLLRDAFQDPWNSSGVGLHQAGSGTPDTCPLVWGDYSVSGVLEVRPMCGLTYYTPLHLPLHHPFQGMPPRHLGPLCLL